MVSIFEIKKANDLLTIWFSKRFVEDRSNACLFNGCTMRPIGSHSIAESKILKRISVNNCVMYYTPAMEISERIITKVSVFGGFCNKHDAMFYPIDNNDYVQGNKEQEFLFFYRAFCRSFTTKTIMVNSYGKLISYIKKNELGRINPYFNQKGISSDLKLKLALYFKQVKERQELILQDLCSFKKTLDHYYATKRFDRIKSLIIEFDKEYGLAVGACSNIGADFHGHRLVRDIPLSFTIFPQNGKTYTIFSFLKKHSNSLRFLDTELLNEPEERQKRIISYLIANSTDNWAFSPNIWNTFSNTTKKEFESLTE